MQYNTSSEGNPTAVLARSDASVSISTRSGSGPTDVSTVSTTDLDELLERHSDKILSKLLSKLNPQQQELFSELN